MEEPMKPDMKDRGTDLSSYNADILSLLNRSMHLALQEQYPDRSIHKLLEFWGTELESDRVYIFEYTETEEGGQRCNNTYEWCAPGIRPEIDGLQNIPREAGAIWEEEFQKNGCAIVKHVEDIRYSNPPVYELLKPQQLTSVITCPIYHEGTLLGFFGLDNPPAEKMENLSEALSVIGSFLDSLIIRRNLMRELKQQSLRDSLTNLGNTRAMEQKIAEIDPNASCFVLFSDVCGLKKINDAKGHAAGDDLLMETADALRTLFLVEQVFRVGGDEFVVILENISQEESERILTSLHEINRKISSPLAIGSVWREKAQDINEMIRIADRRMYEDKKQYYAMLQS